MIAVVGIMTLLAAIGQDGQLRRIRLQPVLFTETALVAYTLLKLYAGVFRDMPNCQVRAGGTPHYFIAPLLVVVYFATPTTKTTTSHPTKRD
jgi:hypothetical protein